jgi:ubiquitin-conjugating enzyme E2 variant
MAYGSAQSEQRDRAALQKGYSRSVRRFEIASIVAYAVAMSWLLARLWPAATMAPWLVLRAFMLGFVLADFASGVVHWLADTWGSPETPIVGRALIRPFREHHVDAKEITRHDFVETNGNNCFICLGPLALTALVSLETARSVFCASATFSLCLWVFCTNQFHKWSHLDDPPPLVDRLQRVGLILPRDHHAVHHAAPFTKYYCITVGWLNEPLRRVRFFPLLERIVTLATGWLPREDDIGTRAAAAVIEADPPPGDAAALHPAFRNPQTR